MTGPTPIGLWAIIRALLPRPRDPAADQRRHRLDEEDLQDLEADQTGVRQDHARQAVARTSDDPEGFRGAERQAP